jgi:serine/threonine-protein kinase RsbW
MVLMRRLPEAGSTEARKTAAGATGIPAWEGLSSRRFPRSLDSLDRIFAFVGEWCASGRAGESERYALGFAVEELFTNMVKYNPAGQGDIELELERNGDELIARVSDPDSERFDVTATPDAGINLPIEQREPGGLGLHLVRRVMDEVGYEYRGRCSRITIRKRLEGK